MVRRFCFLGCTFVREKTKYFYLLAGFAPRPTRLDFGESPTDTDQVSPQKTSNNRQSKGPAPPIPTQHPHRNEQVFFAWPILVYFVPF